MPDPIDTYSSNNWSKTYEGPAVNFSKDGWTREEGMTISQAANPYNNSYNFSAGLGYGIKGTLTEDVSTGKATLSISGYAVYGGTMTFSYDPDTGWQLDEAIAGVGGILGLSGGLKTGLTGFAMGAKLEATAGVVLSELSKIGLTAKLTGTLTSDDVKAKVNFFTKLEATFAALGKALGITDCFLEGTMVDMWPVDMKPDVNHIYDEKQVLAKVWQKPIEEVTPEDWVVSYDDNGRLKPGRVTRTFQNHSKHILDVHGLMMTPGHVTYCAKVKGEENRFAGKHVPVMDILRSDGALKKNDGTLIRASTGCEVGSKDDKQFWAFLLYEDKDGSERIREKCQLRLGTRWILPNGHHFSMREYMDGIGIELIMEGPHKGYVRFKKTGVVTVFAWTLSETLPKPEDYVLQRSQVTLEEIYSANEWEAVRPQSPAPFMGEVGHSFKQDSTLYAGASGNQPPNIPLSMRNSSNQPTMSRQQRRAIERRQRKAEKRSAVIVH